MLDVAGVGRAVAAGAEVWRGGVPGGAEACRGAGGLRHPEAWFHHRRAGPAGAKKKNTC